MSFLDNLEWRYATKKFNTNKPVAKNHLEKILKAIRFVPSSRGLQPFHVYVVENLDFRKKLKPIANDQDQINSCTYLLIFCAITDRPALLERIDKRLEITATLQNQSISELESLKTSMQSTINKKTDRELNIWVVRQTYIALGFALAATLDLKIDSCPMEGFNRKKMNQALSLPDSQKSQVLLAIGYRDEEPKQPKMRFPNDDLFTYL